MVNVECATLVSRECAIASLECAVIALLGASVCTHVNVDPSSVGGEGAKVGVEHVNVSGECAMVSAAGCTHCVLCCLQACKA